MKWPASWITTRKREAGDREHPAHSDTPPFAEPATAPSSSAARDPGLAVAVEEVLEVGGGRRRDDLEHPLDERRDAGERQVAVEERGDGDLVGRVEHAGRHAAGRARLPRQPQAGERVGVGLLERQRADRREVEVLDRQIDPIGAVERVGDRHPHVGVAEMGEGRAVDEVDQRVDQRLRVDDDVDAVVGDAEQVMGLDQLEALVHQRRRVDRDLAAHLPGRVGERLLAGHAREVRATSERAARRGQDQAIDDAGRLRGDQLMQRRMLGVDGGDPGAARLRERHHELAADDEALLVGEGELDALAEGDDRRAEAGRADDRVEHDVGLGARGSGSRIPSSPPRTSPLQPESRADVGGPVVGERDAADTRRAGLLDQPLPAAVGAQAADPQIGGALDHVDRLLADRAGRARG